MDFSKSYEDAVFESFASPSTLNDNSPSRPPFDESAKSLDVPEVRSMEQKGLGLDTLKKSLATFTRPRRNSLYPDVMNTPPDEIDKSQAYDLQEKLEEGAINSAMERWRTDSQKLAKLGVNSVLQSIPINALMWEWQNTLVPLLRQEVEKIDQAEMKEAKSDSDSERCLYGPFLRFLPVERLAAVTIISVMNELCAVGADRGMKLAQLIMHLGGNVQDESFAENLRRGKDSVWQGATSGNRQRMLAKLVRKHQYPNKRTNQAVNSALQVDQPQHKRWTANIKAKVGAVLLSKLIEAAKMDTRRKHPETGEQVRQRQPVFYHGYQYIAGRRVGVILLNPEMVKKLAQEPVGGLVAKHLPMIVEPKPWRNIDEGGFLASSVEAVRMKHGDVQQKQYAKVAAEKGDMDQVFSGLDVLARTAWKVNRGVFDVMLEAWNSGEAIANLAPEQPNIIYPEEPKASENASARKVWMKQMKMVENQKTGLHSQRCFQNFQLEIARSFLNQTFYFPHNVDFRGRAYPIPPYFNHMGADNSRGLLIFAKGKKLGAVGLTWLKVHLSNVFGYDKASFKERHDFTMEHLPDVYDSATHPLNGGRWWLKAEDPWQCLAACMELKNALDLPDPTRFVSHLAIHQDGTCNGLQHYAALGGDSLGARQVNLEPGDRPSDIYTAVAEMIKKEITEEAALGNEVAKVLDGYISRKVVKATVMTNVYGVTYTGARRQVRKQLEEIMPDLHYSAGINHGVTSAYVALKIFKSLSTMFNGAHDIQFWLGECANRISQSLTPEQLQLLDLIANGELPEAREYMMVGSRDKIDHLQFKSSVIWTTPLRMPVVQPYRKTARFEVDTNLQRVSIVTPALSDPVHKKKQLQGFPPNFIHSLDATHMLLSALKCDEVGLTFAAVHDSFWTHAADVDTMNRILRDAFIRMHSEDIIGRLAAEFSARYKGSMYLAAVHRESATGKKIAEHRKLPSTRIRRGQYRRLDVKMAELLVESKRLKLLASDNPAEQEEGRNMVTPGSIFAASAHEEDLAVPEELQGNGIGDMPTRKTKLKANEQLEVGDVANADTLGELAQSDAVQKDETSTTLGEDGDEKTFDVDKEFEEEEEDEKDGHLTKALKRPKRDNSTGKTYVWLPLTFPPVPKKVSQVSVERRCNADTEVQGDFDVARLKDSQYFFS